MPLGEEDGRWYGEYQRIRAVWLARLEGGETIQELDVGKLATEVEDTFPSGEEGSPEARG